MSLDNAITVGELRAALDGIPDDEPVMVIADATAAAWLQQVRHDLGGRTLDMIAGRHELPVEFETRNTSERWPVLVDVRTVRRTPGGQVNGQ